MMFPIARVNGRQLFNQLSCDMDRLFNQAMSPVARAMPVDIHEEGERFVLEAEVPGVTREELEITTENGTLTIAVNRKETDNGSNGSEYHVRERRFGNVSRTFRFPETANLDAVEASLNNGVLTLHVPKKEEAKPRQIPVR
ncbi:MAG TPA: Hsp20/alpha crystallin family protein [Phycisphaerae bacterium]|nr:Hsp20/alpha crystallin family protein [Phycisphaerae bacterium]HOJ76317.1 Hsp20/alpha crystallin family protein [Phycisphaerae bacterium]HOM53731.1 Hsp20/alpha crystallin family protein [Phycisphaerae bacterium]HON66492.1 Hsp20/alpha crystallin family protein [Phycisphaerae bacterium]HOQ85643.1 Hsp20/alpha crystallin family protein [Phycisphaerae bacterium]